jgi:hypothetical protein
MAQIENPYNAATGQLGNVHCRPSECIHLEKDRMKTVKVHCSDR